MQTKQEQEQAGSQPEPEKESDADSGSQDTIESKASKKMEDEDQILSCPECGSTRLREKLGDLYCQECGMVIDEDRVKEDAGPRAFTAEEKQKKERTGSPVTYTEASRGLRTKIGSGSGGMNQVSPEKRGQYYRMRKWNQRLDESKDRRMKFALGELESLVDVLGLPDSVTEEAARLYEKALEQEVVKGRKIEAIVSALVYIVSRNQRVPRTMAEIAEESDISERDLGKTYRYVARELDLRIVPVNPQDFIPRYSSKLD
ncbi:MAG: transcription initiation factor IIB family protein, partial [Candidatus Nanohaloarchaea archaeon]